MDAPSGLDLNPRPPRSVRVSKRAAGTLMLIAAIILGLFACIFVGSSIDVSLLEGVGD